MNNAGLELRLSDKGKYLILDGSNIPSNLDENEFEYLNSLPHDTALLELLESYLCNGWQTIDAALFGGMVLESPDGVLYADVEHQTHNAVSQLLEGKNYHFHRIEKDD
jgi:hypothetical protein